MRFVRRGEDPIVWIGANFWSRQGGPLMWRDVDRDLLREELTALRDHGLTMTRSFFYWPDTMPTADQLDPDVVDRFEVFLDLHHELGMTSVPTFIVGHMSGENWDPSWRAGRDLYADTWLVARQAWYARTLVSRFASHPAVVGWLISNEMPIYGGAAERETVTSWAELMVQAVRAGGGRQPVSLGDGAWGIEVTGEDNGFSVRDTADIVDFVGPHVYRMETDVVRQHLKAAFICELAAVAEKPVVLEEFGVTSDFASDEHAAHYYRQTLHNSLLAGATGWIGWNNTDFDNLADQDPYRHHAFELHFGLTRVDGSPKPQLLEMRDFAETVEAIDLTRCHRWPAQAALVVPAYLETAEPLTQSVEERTPIFASLEQAHVAAREADLAVHFAREVDGIPDGLPLYLVPSTKALTAPTWRRLGELARAGATVYASHGLGDADFQRGPWWSGLEEIFGVRHQLMYGITEPLEDDVIEVTFERDLGPLRSGDVLRIPVAGSESARSMLPVEALDAEVVARDQRGRVVLTTHRIGAGIAVLSTVPTELLAAARPRANPEPTWQLYDALAELAGVARRVQVDSPHVLVDGLVHDDGREFVWFVSESADSQVAAPRVPDGMTLRPLSGGDAVTKVELPAYGVTVLQMTQDQAQGDTVLGSTDSEGNER
ncbi:cellulase family glycosylhydrolase [Luteipulveratus mongoliensis]|uniref:Beta-mannosidase n=1 Tax=Luteipulveratus mongoliensis TaxID=571913 RepID=A0A0K1JL80_9MICO|nr:cellulase family glycosylhydrolase [Luteipulveratus mongoliensis]AKU17471.1 beta-mannosidase [Luteipulveratus mongoliensis]